MQSEKRTWRYIGLDLKPINYMYPRITDYGPNDMLPSLANFTGGKVCVDYVSSPS